MVILAETRAHELTFDLFKRHLLDVVDGDLALCVARNEREDIGNPFYRHARFVWSVDEPADWGEAFDEACIAEGGDPAWRKILQIKDQWLGGICGPGEHPGSAGILLYFRWFLKGQLEREGLLHHYERIIITRSDFMHLAPHPPLRLLDPQRIWIPEGEDHGGYTDRHVVLPAADTVAALGISDRLIMDPDGLVQEMAGNGDWNLERYIKFGFDRAGLTRKVSRYPYTMFTVRARDGHTRWSAGHYNERLGYAIKYPNEYRRACLVARWVGGVDGWTSMRLQLFLLAHRWMSWCEQRPVKRLRKRWRKRLRQWLEVGSQ